MSGRGTRLHRVQQLLCPSRGEATRGRWPRGRPLPHLTPRCDPPWLHASWFQPSVGRSALPLPIPARASDSQICSSQIFIWKAVRYHLPVIFFFFFFVFHICFDSFLSPPSSLSLPECLSQSSEARTSYSSFSSWKERHFLFKSSHGNIDRFLYFLCSEHECFSVLYRITVKLLVCEALKCHALAC